MKYRYELLFFTLVLSQFLSCERENSIDSMEGVYYNYIFSSSKLIDCDEIQVDSTENKENNFTVTESDGFVFYTPSYQRVVDTIVADRKILKEIQIELDKLEILEDTFDVDARIRVEFNYSNGENKKLCIGGEFTNHMMLDGKKVKTNNRLLYLIKYNLGFYSWLHNYQLDIMDELQDTTFRRIPIKQYDFIEKMDREVERNR